MTPTPAQTLAAGSAGWRGGDDLGIRAGEAVVLRFELDQARIFALDFE